MDLFRGLIFKSKKMSENNENICYKIYKDLVVVHRGLIDRLTFLKSFVSEWSHFEVLIATAVISCKSSSGDEVDCLRVTICNILVRCY